MAKIYGQLISAQFECLATDPANHPLSRPYFNTASKTIKYYDGTSWLTIVDRVYLATVTLANPMTTMGDIIYGGASGAVTRLPAGAANTVLVSAPATAPAWSLLADANIASGANIDAAKLGTGAISTTVFNYLTGVTSSIQTQLNAKQATITVLPIANGGTGAITAPLAFANLSPLSAKGDLLVFGTANTRLPASTDGFALFLDSTQTLGVKWAAIPPSGYATSVITANPSPAVNNTQYLANTTSAAFSITLPAGSTGAKIKIQDDKGTWDSNNLTITPATGERIFPLAANASLVCNVVRGWIELVWDGAGWSPNSLASTTLGSGSGLIGIQQSGAVTAVNGVMYECDTTSAGFTLTLPSGTSAAVVGILDAGPFFTTNNLTVNPGTGQFIDVGAVNDGILFDGNRQSCVFYRANGSSTWEIQTSSQTAYAPGFTPGNTSGAIGTGNFGEKGFQEILSGAALTLASGVPKDIIAFTLQPGSYRLGGFLGLTTAATGAYNSLIYGIRTAGSANTLPPVGEQYLAASITESVATQTNFKPAPIFEIDITVATTYTLVVQAGISASTLAAFGRISYRRVA